MEIWDIIDKDGNPTGRTIVRGQPLKPGDYHLAVHIWIVNSSGQILIQKRAETVKQFPGIWASTGGSALTGETSIQAVTRELNEELGITATAQELKKLTRVPRKDNLLDIWLLKTDIDIQDLKLQAEEVSDAKYVTPEELKQMIKAGTFFNYGEDYLQLIWPILGRTTF